VVAPKSQDEWPGRWNLVSDPEVEVAGTLHLTPRLNMKLQLLGTFPSTPQFNWESPLVANGITIDGHEVTVELTHDAMVGTSGFGERKTYGIRRVISGAQLATLDPAVMSVEFGLSHLHDWAQAEAFSGQSSFGEYPYGATHSIAYQEPQPITLISTPDLSLHLLFSAALPFTSPRSRSNSLHSYCSLRLDSALPVPLSTLLPIVGRLRSLLSFATAIPNSVTFLTAFTQRDDSQSLRKRIQGQRLDFYPVDDPVETSNDVLYPHQMLFTLSDDSEQSFGVTRSWLPNWPRLGPLLRLYLSATQSADLYQEHSFLSLVQAIEGFHRINYPHGIVPRSAHRERVRRIAAAVAPEDRDLVKSALQYSNEPSLRQRIKALLTIGLATVPDFMGQPEKFISRCVSTRHYFSHAAPGLRGKAATSIELYSMVQVLTSLFEIVTLLHFSWSPDAVRKVVGRSLKNRSARGTIRFVLEDRWGKA
jgi:hypothetical protein